MAFTTGRWLSADNHSVVIAVFHTFVYDCCHHGSDKDVQPHPMFIAGDEDCAAL